MIYVIICTFVRWGVSLNNLAVFGYAFLLCLPVFPHLVLNTYGVTVARKKVCWKGTKCC